MSTIFKTRKDKEARLKAELKMWFFKDLFECAAPDDNNIFERIEHRKKTLLKNGYFNSQGEVTTKGKNRLIVHLVNIVNSKLNKNQP